MAVGHFTIWWQRDIFHWNTIELICSTCCSTNRDPNIFHFEIECSSFDSIFGSELISINFASYRRTHTKLDYTHKIASVYKIRNWSVGMAYNFAEFVNEKKVSNYYSLESSLYLNKLFFSNGSWWLLWPLSLRRWNYNQRGEKNNLLISNGFRYSIDCADSAKCRWHSSIFGMKGCVVVCVCVCVYERENK